MLTSHYPTLLAIHNVLRWFVLIAGFAAVIGCVIGLAGKKPFVPLGRILGLLYVSLLDTQVLIGILLSLASPLIHAFWSAPGLGMKTHDLRYFAVEHSFTMLIALALAHIGAVKSRKAKESTTAYSKALLWYGLSILVLVAGIPWWRSLIRF